MNKNNPWYDKVKDLTKEDLSRLMNIELQMFKEQSNKTQQSQKLNDIVQYFWYEVEK